MIRQFLPSRGILGYVVTGLLFSAIGCGSGTVGNSTVTGTVSYKGKPLTVGTIEFYGPAGKVSSSSINPDGTFTVPDAPVGDDTVVVRVPPPGPKLPPGAPVLGPQATPVPIPRQYSDPKTSHVKQTVAAGKSTVNIDLK
jgi:hypothetical protein